MKLDNAYKNVSVSTGTLDVNELAYNCFGFLRLLQLDRAKAERLQSAKQRLAASDKLNADTARILRKNLLFNHFFELLEDISPEGCYFGIHPGDPGNLGFWDKSLKFNPD